MSPEELESPKVLNNESNRSQFATLKNGGEKDTRMQCFQRKSPKKSNT